MNREGAAFAGFGKIPALDGMRGLAVLLVVVSHSLGLVIVPQIPVWVLNVIQAGWMGVDLFFVLSGFLITSLLLDERRTHGRVSLRAFYARRALRLFPALYLLLAVYAVWTWVAGLPWRETGVTLGSALLYVNNWQAWWFPLTCARGLGHLWSLSIEEQFYLVWPTVFLLFIVGRRRWTGAILLLAAIGAIVALRPLIADEIWVRTFIGTDTRADSLLAGALAAWLWANRMVPRAALRLAGWAGAAGFALLLCTRGSPASPFWWYGGFTLLAATAAIMVLAIVEGSWAGARLFEVRWLRALGRVSYGLYLWHFFVFDVVGQRATQLHPAARLALAVSITAAFTTSSWFFVERPAQRWRRRFEIAHPPAAPARFELQRDPTEGMLDSSKGV